MTFSCNGDREGCIHARQAAPKAITKQAAIRGKVNVSARKNRPIRAANTTLVSYRDRADCDQW
jgi:hypothetical protein